MKSISSECKQKEVIIMINIYKGDALSVMDILIKKGVKVDAVIADIPYGTTACPWDEIIPLQEMWID